MSWFKILLLIIFYVSFLMVMTHIKNLIFLFICLELMNLGILLYMINLLSGSFFHIIMIIIIQVCDSLLLMLLYFKNMSLWENFNNWMLSHFMFSYDIIY